MQVYLLKTLRQLWKKRGVYFKKELFLDKDLWISQSSFALSKKTHNFPSNYESF